MLDFPLFHGDVLCVLISCLCPAELCPSDIFAQSGLAGEMFNVAQLELN